MDSRDEFAQATARAKQRRVLGPYAMSAHYDRRSRRIVVRLNSGIDLAFAPRDAQGLENASLEQLSNIEVSPSGLGMHFPKLDADISVPGLLEGLLGSRAWMAARLGARGGRSTSPAKRAAARANGQSGGRPRKTHPRQSETTEAPISPRAME